MTGDVGWPQRRFFFEHSQGSDRCGQYCRLGVLGQFEICFGTAETNFTKKKSKSIVRFGKSFFGGSELGAELLPHADVL